VLGFQAMAAIEKQEATIREHNAESTPTSVFKDRCFAALDLLYEESDLGIEVRQASGCSLS
jgi:hypothetical protein